MKKIFLFILLATLGKSAFTQCSVPTFAIQTQDSIIFVGDSINIKTCNQGTSFTSFQWQQIGGIQATIVSPTSANTTIKGFTLGIAQFLCTATDINGKTYTDMITVTAVNKCPVCPVCPKARTAISVSVTATGTIVTYDDGTTSKLN